MSENWKLRLKVICFLLSSVPKEAADKLERMYSNGGLTADEQYNSNVRNFFCSSDSSTGKAISLLSIFYPALYAIGLDSKSPWASFPLLDFCCAFACLLGKTYKTEKCGILPLQAVLFF